MMSFSELGRVIDQLVKDRGIQREVIIKAIEQAFLVAARKKFGLQGEYETRYNEQDEDIEIYQYKNIVETVRDPILEISFDEARKLDESCEVGDQLGLKIDNPGFSRVDVQMAKQIIFQKVRDAEREILFKEFKHREGELVTGIVRRQEKVGVIVDLGKSDALLPRQETIPGEMHRTGDRVQAYLSEVVMTTRGPEIRLSRTSPVFLVSLFEIEVPEIQDGTIEIKAAAREPGHRAKIAVYTPDKDIDPVGACVGMKGARVQNVVNELQGEKIDIVKWSPDIETFARAALAPAEIASLKFDGQKSMDVVVEEDQLSLAIGRRGQNVRLAAMLTGCRINIISKAKLQEKVKMAVENLSQLAVIGPATAQILANKGIYCLHDLQNASIEDICRFTGMDHASAEKVHAAVDEALNEGQVEALLQDVEEVVSASAVPSDAAKIQLSKGASGKQGASSDKFSEAERRLREELAAFKLK